jgi:hypothetical protein
VVEVLPGEAWRVKRLMLRAWTSDAPVGGA